MRHKRTHHSGVLLTQTSLKLSLSFVLGHARRRRRLDRRRADEHLDADSSAPAVVDSTVSRETICDSATLSPTDGACSAAAATLPASTGASCSRAASSATGTTAKPTDRPTPTAALVTAAVAGCVDAAAGKQRRVPHRLLASICRAFERRTAASRLAGHLRQTARQRLLTVS